MKKAIWLWRLHRVLIDHFRWMRHLSRQERTKRMLFMRERDPICHNQLFPFFLFSVDLAESHHIQLRGLPLHLSSTIAILTIPQVDAVCFQTWFDLTNLSQRIETTWLGAKIAYFDWFAPTDLRFVEVQVKHISACVKKQTLRDGTQYESSILWRHQFDRLLLAPVQSRLPGNPLQAARRISG